MEQRRPANHEPTSVERLKLTEAFRGVYRQGRWARMAALSVGARSNVLSCSRVGFRTKRGLKGAVERNRLKRQLRAIWQPLRARVAHGYDIVIVIHPRSIPIHTKVLEAELLDACHKLRLLS